MYGDSESTMTGPASWEAATFVLVCTHDEAHLHRVGCADVPRTLEREYQSSALPLAARRLPQAEEEALTAGWDAETAPLIVVKPCTH